MAANGALSPPLAPHVLVFPFPAQGHMIPLLDHAHDLSSHGLSVTVVVTPKNLPLLAPLLSRSPSIRTLLLLFPANTSIPPGVENVKDLPAGYFFDMMHALGRLHDPLLRWARSQPDPPDAIVSDMFLGWTHHLATELGIPRLVFCPSGANTLAIVHCLWRDMPKRADPEDDEFPIAFPTVPNSHTYPWWQISPNYRRYKEGDPVSEFVKDGYLANFDSWGFVFNSFHALDGPYLDHMSNDLGHPRVWAVGPIRAATADRGGASSIPVEVLLEWLDTCPAGSVVYVCFGSQVVLRREQMEALAAALERSGARFVWAVKQPPSPQGGSDDDRRGAVPEGFEERTAGRGVVIKGWAPQVAILNHPAVGSFLSHCGWNSVLEAVSAGVVVLAWPMGADQYMNARVLVEELGVAGRACVGPDAVPDAEALGRVMAEAAGGGLVKGKALDLCRKARKSVGPGGSSERDLVELVSELNKLTIKRQQ